MPHTLLLADDSITIQRVIELTFAEEDVDVIAVGDGRAAIEQIERRAPDIVLADVGMPERDGYDVAAFMKARPELAGIPVLLLTGAFEPIDESRAKAVGCAGVLVKPFEPQMVIGRVKDLLAGRRPAGMWSQVTGAAGAPVRPSVAPALKAEPPPAPAGSLEDYFDRLDAAFASLEAGGPPPPAASAPPMPVLPEPVSDAPRADLGADLDGWDPDLEGDARQVPSSMAAPARPQAVAAPAPPAGVPPPRETANSSAPPHVLSPAPAAPAPTTSPSQTTVPAVSLPDAFAALLAAERGHPFAPSEVGPQAAVPDEAIEDAVRRVVGRLTEQVVRETVLDVAERVVREEIARIKGHTDPR